jgi:hypothetical protein
VGAALSGFVDIPANRAFAVLMLMPTDELLREPEEPAIFTVLLSSDFALGTRNGVTITIVDHDRVITSPRRKSARYTNPQERTRKRKR